MDMERGVGRSCYWLRVSDPYRTPGAVETIERRRGKLRSELMMLQMLNANGRTPEELARMQARINELVRLLGALR